MTLRHLKIFAAVYRHSSITRAAEALHLAQPSVSLAVKELENYYGIRLFERLGRRITPTEGGTAFYGYAIHIVSLFAEMETRMRNWDAFAALRVGTSITIGVSLLPGLIQAYQKRVPGVEVRAEVRKSAEIEQMLLHNEIDLGLIETQPQSPELVAVPFQENFLRAIVWPGHPLCGKAAVSLQALAQSPFLVREPGSAERNILEAYFAMEGLPLRPVWESASTQALVKAVAAGLGVSILPERLVARDVAEGTVATIPLQYPMRRTLNALHHKSKYLTPNMRTFLALCQEIGQESFEK